MNWHTIHRLLPWRSLRHRLLVFTLAALMGLGQLIQAADSAAAATTNAGAQADTGLVANAEGDPVLDPALLGQYPPPPLMNPRGGLYAATEEQLDSIRVMEEEAIVDVTSLHTLTQADRNALKTWGRSEVLAQLFINIAAAIKADEADRTTHQQNVVEWMTAVVDRKEAMAAEAAAREYVKWAGLNQLAYESLVADNPSQAALTDFLDDHPLNYNNPDTNKATGGYCVYRAPSPYTSEYTGYNDPTCFTPCMSPIGCQPPTPAYDSFTKWGEAYASAAWLSAEDYSEALETIGTAVLLGAVVVGVAVSGAVLSTLLVAIGSVAAASLAGTIAALTEAGIAVFSTAIQPILTLASGVAAGAAIVGVIIFALVAAITEGQKVIGATKLPGQLAELVTDTQADTPDLAALMDSDEGMQSIFTLFVGATLPTPIRETCDNDAPTRLPPNVIIKGQVIQEGLKPCLNPSPIPAPSPYDTNFLVQVDGGNQTLSDTITWLDPMTDRPTTARLSRNWFVTEVDGTTSMALQIAYTNWDGEERYAWLLGASDVGFVVVSVDIPKVGESIDFDTCLDDGTCSEGTTLEYMGPDGREYRASLRAWQAPVGAPSVSPWPVEGSPVTFDFNQWRLPDAVGPIDYEWRFQREDCGSMACQTMVDGKAAPLYGDPVPGWHIEHTFKRAGTYAVELKMVDADGKTATTTISVNVANVPPTLGGLRTLASSLGSETMIGSASRVRGIVHDAGEFSDLTMTVDWGDGTVNQRCAALGPAELCGSLSTLPLGDITFQEILGPDGEGTGRYNVSASHVYAARGTYQGLISVRDQSGGWDSDTFERTVKGNPQPFGLDTFKTTFTYGEPGFTTAVMRATATGEGEPIVYSIIRDTSTCSISEQFVQGGSGDYLAFVHLDNAGDCWVVASRAGTDVLEPAVLGRKLVVSQAPLTVTAPNSGRIYDGSLPSTLTPSFAGFRLGDDVADIDILPTCAVDAPAEGTAGMYQTICSGGADRNYAMSYVAGTFKIEQAWSPLTAESLAGLTVYGQAAEVRAWTVPGAGAAPTGTVEFKVGDAAIPGCEARPLDPASLVATCDTTGLGAGDHEVIATYSGDVNHASSTATTWRQVFQAETTLGVEATTSTNLVSGQPITLTAQLGVVSPGAGTPTGSVEFRSGAASISECAAMPIDPATKSATCTTALPVGNHSISASYAGDANFVGNTSASVGASVAKAATGTSVGASTSPSIKGAAVTFTAQIPVVEPGSGMPSGTVTFLDGTTRLGTATITTVGNIAVASLTTSTLAVGRHSITASYAGNASFAASTSQAIEHYVNTDLSRYPKLASGAWNFAGANLKNASLYGVSLVGADLTGANIANAVLIGANLEGAKLDQVTATGANFEAAEMATLAITGGNYKSARFTTTNLTGTSFDRVNLRGAKDLATATLNGVTWTKTICPDGTQSARIGNTCLGHLN